MHRRRNHQRGAFGALDGEALGRQLAEDDVQEGDQQEGQGGRDRLPGGWSKTGPGPQGLDQVRKGRLADPAQRQRSERDPQLRGAAATESQEAVIPLS